VQAADDRLQRDAAPGMSLRIEEDLGPPDVLGRRPLQVGPGQVVEVLLLAQHGTGGVIDVEERLQVGEHIRAPEGLDRVIWQGDAVAPGQLEHERRLQGALDVQVQFGLGDGVDEGIQVRHLSG